MPENEDFEEENDRKSVQEKVRSSVKQEVDEKVLEEDKHKNKQLLELIEDLTEENRGLEKKEQNALIKFEKEYSRKIRILEQTEEFKKDLEHQLSLIMIDNETLLKENEWRKEFNIANAKEIEFYVKENNQLKNEVKQYQNQSSNWKLKYQNQELIKNNVESNPKFRENYIDMMSESKVNEVYKGRLSQVVKIRPSSRFTDKKRFQSNFIDRRAGTKINTATHKIKEEANEEDNSEGSDNLANELEGLEETDFGGLEQRDGSEHADDYEEGVYRASELDRDRFTVADKGRASNINIGLEAKDFKKTNLQVIVEDDYYDPVKEKVKELKEAQGINKEKVIQQLKNQEELDEHEEDKDEIEKDDSENEEGKN